MRKIYEILRLRWEAGLNLRAIASSCGVSHNTVKDILRRAEAADLRWPLPDNCDETSLEAKLYPEQTQLSLLRPEPDMNWIHRELRRKGVTLRLLSLEYKEQYPDGLQYSQFCERYRQWKQKLDVSLRQVYRAGEKMFVDYAGQTVPIVDPDTGEVREAQIFIRSLEPAITRMWRHNGHKIYSTGSVATAALLNSSAAWRKSLYQTIPR